MGTLVYGHRSAARVEVDDVLLAHLKTVALTKLRRKESFALTIHGIPGRTTLWIHPSTPLQFHFDADDRVDMDRELIQDLMQHANTGEVTIRDGAAQLHIVD
ncbi:hypothetical protein ITJ57_08255 [Plantibacter sp. VKM Ac-2880]|uniref:DUF7882 family protein n=1 Tax=Plantibacter sp. VKM Ac-2880 TaxID=2783827 RepID=UPI00188F9083|nr:hypothetical protein [Plantibacter sp. VKM Ac-2880]MBF4568762.1 hypothetical protein [Plantibacter sp. VKM Ac-2880]